MRNFVGSSIVTNITYEYMTQLVFFKKSESWKDFHDINPDGEPLNISAKRLVRCPMAAIYRQMYLYIMLNKRFRY